jgi:hypothetical protein
MPKGGDTGQPEEPKVELIEVSGDFNWIFELVNLSNEEGELHSPLLWLLREVLEDISRERIMKETALLKQLTDIPRERQRIEYAIIGNQLEKYIGLDSKLSGIDLLPYMYPYLFIVERTPVSGSFTPDGDEIIEIDTILTTTDIIIGFIDFLNATPPERIKKCQQCQRLYLSDQRRAGQKYCSETCKNAANWPPGKRAEYTRQRREKKRMEMKKKAEVLIEKEIQRRMRICDCTREEIVEQMKADKTS